MARRRPVTTRISSKGQIVIPAKMREELGLTTGRLVRLEAVSPRRLVLSVESPDDDLDEMLRRAGAWKSPVDELEELHERRRMERAQEAMKHGRRRT